jgi:hypothetical protein
MRVTALVSALAILGTTLASPAAGEGKPGENKQAMKAKPEAQEQTYPGVRQQQGRVLTDSDLNSSNARKVPGLHKSGDVTLKRGIISRDAAIQQRRALEPLKKRVSTAGMRTAEAEYVKELRGWAVAQDKRLLELQKKHTAYDRLKEYRDNAAKSGEDTSRIDPRLAGMEREMESLSGLIHSNYQQLEKMSERYERRAVHMSNLSKSLHETAKALIHNTRS